MTEENKNLPVKADEAFKLHQQIIKAGQLAQLAFLAMGKMLWEMKEQNYFKQLQYETFNAYLHDSDLPIKPSVGHALVKIQEQLVARLGLADDYLAQIGQTKAIILARAIDGRELAKEQVDELLEQAKVSPAHTLRQVIRESVEGIKQDECKHQDIVFKRCKTCYRISYDA